MGKASLDRVRRNSTRVKRMVDRSNQAAVKVAGAAVAEAEVAFDAADQGVQHQTAVEQKEKGEGQAAVGALRPVYDMSRSALLVHHPLAKVAGRAKSFATPDDLLIGAVTLEDYLARVAGVDAEHPLGGQGASAPTGEAWALTLLEQLVPAVNAAKKEHDEAVGASADLQKAKERRAEKRAVLEERIRAFRWLVRDAFGVHSKEYHSLRDRTASEADEDEDEEPVVVEPKPGDPPVTK
jgi:hypothetical protein